MRRTAAIRPFLLAVIATAGWATCIRAVDPDRDCDRKDVQLRTLSWAEAEKFIGQQTGKVVLVDVWTTTCPTCREHFPEFVKLGRRLAGKDVVCVSLNCDYDGVPGKPPEHYALRVLAFLKDKNARSSNILLSDPLLDFLDAAGIGSTPTYLLYGRDGKLQRRFDGSEEEFRFAEVAQAVESAISTAGGNATKGNGN